MATTVETPPDDQRCTFCGSRIFDHDPVCVRDCDADCGAPDYFCNLACLAAHVDEHDLTAGASCEWSPE